RPRYAIGRGLRASVDGQPENLDWLRRYLTKDGDKMTKNETIRLSFSFGLISLGALMVALHSETPAGTLLSHVGFAFIVAGVLSFFHEAVLRRFEQGDMALEIANEIERKLRATPLQATGIRLLAPIRKGMDKYYEWAIQTSPDDVFLAGR